MVNKSRPPPKELRPGSSRSSDRADSGETISRTASASASKGSNHVVQVKKSSSLKRTPDAPEGKPIKLPNKVVGEGAAMKKSDAGSKKALLQRPAAAKAPADPAYSYTHWDYVMMEMKWMAQDFMQERRWKMAACAHLAAKAQSARGSLVGDGVKPDNEAEEEKREGTSEQDTAKDPVEDGHGSAEGTNADKEPKANGDIKIGEDSGKKTGTRSQTGEPSAPIPAEPKPFGKEGADWCITFHMTADLKKAVVAKVVQVDVRRALAQDLRVHEYRLDYDAACASVALSHQVAKEDADRRVKEAEQQVLAQAHLAAEEEASHKRRLKKKSKSGLDFLDDEMELPGVKKQQHLVSMASLGAAAGRPPRPGSGPVPPIHQAGSSLPAGMSAVGAMGAGLVRSGSVVRGDVVLKDGILEAGHKRKTDKKRKKGDIMDGDLATTHAAAATDLLDADGQGLKRLGPGMETPGSARGGLERRPPKKSKPAKSAVALEVANEALARKGRKLAIVGDILEWSPQEDQLLCAIVLEFGQNFALVADIFANASPVKGVHRKPEHCKVRHKQLSTPGPDGSLDAGLTYLRTNKGAAREVLTNAIPIPEAVLARQLAVLVNVSTRLMNSVEEERKRKAEANQHRHMFHNSHTSIEMKCLHANMGKHLSPLELVDISNQLFAQQQQGAIYNQAPPQQQPAANQSQQPAAQAQLQRPALAGPALAQAQVAPINTVPPQQVAVASPAVIQGQQPAAATQQMMAGAQQTQMVGAGQPQQPATGQPGVMVQPSIQLPPNLQAAIQARVQQQVAQITQQRALTPLQQQHLVARLTAQQTQQIAQQQQQAAAAQQQQTQVMHSAPAQQLQGTQQMQGAQQMLLQQQQQAVVVGSAAAVAGGQPGTVMQVQPGAVALNPQQQQQFMQQAQLLQQHQHQAVAAAVAAAGQGVLMPGQQQQGVQMGVALSQAAAAPQASAAPGTAGK